MTEQDAPPATRDELRQRYAQAIGDPGSVLPRGSGQSVPRWAADAVLAVRDEELQELRDEAAQAAEVVADLDARNAENHRAKEAAYDHVEAAERERDKWSERACRKADEAADLLDRAELAEAGLAESSWPDGGPDDKPPEVKLAELRTLLDELDEWTGDDNAGRIATRIRKTLDGDDHE